MKILDKYTLKGFTMPLIYCFVVFYMLFIVADILGHLDEILNNKVPIPILAKFYLSFLPAIFVQTMPIAALLGTVFLISGMNTANELTAIKASGINIYLTLTPIFVLGVVLALIIFYVNENVAPQASLISNKIKKEYIDSKFKSKEMRSLENLTVYGKKNQMIYAKRFNSIENKLEDIIILEHGESQLLKRKIIAKEARWIVDNWVFRDVIIYNFNRFGKQVGKVLIFDERVIEIGESPAELLAGEFSSNYMNYRQLNEYIGRLKGSDKTTLNRLKTDLHFKFALPFSIIIMMLLGIPFALTTMRGGVASSVGISIIIGLTYYASMGLTIALGKGSFLPPIVAAHISNLVFLVIAFILIKRAPA